MYINIVKRKVLWTLLIISLTACSNIAPEEDLDAKNENIVIESTEVVRTDTILNDNPKETVEETSQNEQNNQVAATKGELKVYYFDVGQGDSTYIKTPNGDDILIDAGNNWYGDDVVNELKRLGVDDIEVMISTHPDADHVGGLDVVLQNFEVKSVYAPKVGHTTQTFEDFLLAVRDEGLSIKTAKAGVELPLKGIKANFVGPVKEYGDNLNDWSAALHIVYGETSFIFTGDAEEEAEADMLKSGVDLKADVYKVGHHGSNTSTTQAFLDAVNPTYAVISAGADNRYGHPTKETLAKLEAIGAEIYRTDQQGTIIATSDGTNISFNTMPLERVTSNSEEPKEGPKEEAAVVPETKTLEIVSVDLDEEIVKIKNVSSKDIDMTGWKLVSVVGNQTYNFPDNFIIKAGETIEVVSGRGAEEKLPHVLKWSGAYIWNNDGDPAELYNEKGEIVDQTN